jgi:DNA-binding response OmpR family regulator
MVPPEEKRRVVLVEDDTRLAGLISAYLQQQGLIVEAHHRAGPALDSIAASQPDVVILDIVLPDMDGFEACRAIRAHYRGPLLMLTARDEEVDEILGLELGADDYVVKPVSPAVLTSRIRALIRRTRVPAAEAGATSAPLVFGGLSVHRESRRVILDGKVVGLGAREFELLMLLVAHAGTIVSRDQILSSLRGIEYDGLDRSIDVGISRLRRRLGDFNTPPERIKAVRGKGYLFVPDAW